MYTSSRLRRGSYPVCVLTCIALFISGARMLLAAEAVPEQPAKVVDKAALPIPVAEVQPARPIHFANDVLPIFRSNCLACHNAKESKGGLVLETPKAIRAGGESGPAAVPGKSDQSPIMIAASHRDKPFMPPRNNKVSAQALTPEQLGILKLWIDQGAGGDETLHAAPIHWRSLPATLNPIYSVAVSPDGQYAVCSRANQIFVYDVPAQRLVTRLTDPSLSTTPGEMGIAHRDLVQSLTFSPDGRTLASGGYREVKLWSRPEPALLTTLTDAHAKGPDSLLQSPNGKTLAVIGDDNVIRLYGLPSGTLLRELKGHTAAITAVGFAEGGAKICSASLDKTVRVWPTGTAGEAASIETPSAVSAMAVLGNGQIVTAGDEKFFHVWENGKSVKEIPNSFGPTVTLAPAGSGAMFVALDKNHVARLWDSVTGKNSRQIDIGPGVTSIAVRADGKRIAWVGANRLGHVAALEDVNKQFPAVTGDRDALDAVKLCQRKADFANSEVNYARTMVDDATRRQASEKLAIAQANNDLAAAEKAVAVASKNAEATVKAKIKADKDVADLTMMIADATRERNACDASITAAIAAVDDFKPKLAGARAKVDVGAAGEARKAAQAELAQVQKTYDELKAKRDAATQARALADQKMNQLDGRKRDAEFRAREAGKLAVEGDTVWMQSEIVFKSAKQNLLAFQSSLDRAGKDLVEGKSIQQAAEAQVVRAAADLAAARKAVDTAGGTPFATAFTADGGTLLTAGDDDAIRVWSAETSQPAMTIHAPVRAGSAGHGQDAHATKALSAGPQGIVAAAKANGSVEIWNIVGQWKLARTLGTGSEESPLIGRVCSLAFTPDSATLATGGGVPSRTGELKLWSVADGTLTREIVDAHSDTVLSLSFSADGKYLASSSADRFMKVFTVATGKIARSFEGHTDHVLGVSFRYDGRTLITGSADNTLHFWNMVTGEQRPNQGQRPYPMQITSVNYIGFEDSALITAGDGTLRVLREGGGTLRNFDPVKTFLYCGAVTPDGQTIAVGGDDSILRVWQGRDDRAGATFAPPGEK